MIKNEEYSLLNKRIANADMENLCSIFEEKGEKYSCEIFVRQGARYTYKYTKNLKERNPFVTDFFKNLDISKIFFQSKYCRFQYGEESSNRILFEGDEKDETYQNFFTRIDAWQKKLVKLKRIRCNTFGWGNFFYPFCATILSVVLTIGYGFLSDFVNASRLSTVVSSMLFGISLVTTTLFYVVAFPSYEIKIGLCKYKRYQKIFYSMITICIVPFITGLII